MIRIDVASTVPLEEQIAAAIRQAIAAGGVRAGDELPSARQLAADLGVHWNTVARAYRRLADEGLVRGGHGRRTIVEDPARRRLAPRQQTRARLRAQLRTVLADARLGGLPMDDVEEIWRGELRQLRGGKDGA